MHMMHLTEQPMSAYDAKAGMAYGATALNSSNSYFDPNEGSRLYKDDLEGIRSRRMARCICGIRPI